jgi:SAM-dependent methyltransferase
MPHTGQSSHESDDGRRFSAPAERNRDPILAVLKQCLPASGLVLEIASGTGQHIVHFAAALPALRWQPTDPSSAARDSVRAWCKQASLSNVLPPIDLDVRRKPWPFSSVDAVLSINMIHIAPWPATQALFEGTHDVTAPGAVLFLYGPFRRHDRPTAPSNEQFDASLREQDPGWGLRDLETVIEVGATAGFALVEVVDMPANNLSVVFRRMTSRPAT